MGELQSNLAEGGRQESSMQASALAWLAEGRPGPDDRPWVDITKPLWADWYSGNYVGLAPAPLASVSIGVSDLRSNMVRLNRRSTPFDAEQWRQLANPERLALGVMDLSFTFTFFLPLVVILLSFDLRGYERDRGLENLLILQAGRLHRWVGARLLVVGLFAAAPTCLLWLIAGHVSGALVVQTGSWLAGGCLVLAYLLMWIALCGSIAVNAGSASRSALSLAAVWISVCVLVPALVNQIVNRMAPVHYSTEITDAVRVEQYAVLDEPLGRLIEHAYAEVPRIKSLPYADVAVEGPRNPTADRHLYDLARFAPVRHAYSEVAALQRHRISLADRVMPINPVYAFNTGLARLAGTEASAYLRFGDAVLAAIQDRIRRLLFLAWSDVTIDRSRFLELTESAPSDLQITERPSALTWLTLFVWTAIALRFTCVGAGPRTPLWLNRILGSLGAKR